MRTPLKGKEWGRAWILFGIVPGGRRLSLGRRRLRWAEVTAGGVRVILQGFNRCLKSLGGEGLMTPCVRYAGTHSHQVVV